MSDKIKHSVGIVGSRNYQNLERVSKYVCSLPDSYTIVSGGAHGVDTQAVVNAKRRGIETIVHLPNWDKHGKRAGFIRNDLIVSDSDVIVAFWNGSSRGTLDTIKKAVQAGKVVKIYPDVAHGQKDSS